MLIIKVINCDSNECVYEYNDLKEFEKIWNDECSCDFPVLDDELVYASWDGMEIHGETFESVYNVLVENGLKDGMTDVLVENGLKD